MRTAQYFFLLALLSLILYHVSTPPWSWGWAIFSTLLAFLTLLTMADPLESMHVPPPEDQEEDDGK